MADSVVSQRAPAPRPTSGATLRPGSDPPTSPSTSRPRTPTDSFRRDPPSAVAVSHLRAATPIPPIKRDLVLTWEDNFDGPAGTPPDPRFWTHDVGNEGWGNNQLEYDTDSTRNASLDGHGCLAITARHEKLGTSEYTSARIKTEGKIEPLYGRIEASIKLPPGQGLWPAFWMLGNDIRKVGWPQCSETDIMEYRGQQTNKALGTIHGPGYSAEKGISKTFTLANGGFDQAFHTFTVDWDPKSITFSIDGQPYHAITREQVEQHGPWVFDHPMFIILNVAVGGGFVGSPDANTQFPATMLVDWVRVYEKKTAKS